MRHWMILSALISTGAAVAFSEPVLAASPDAGAPIRLSCSFEENKPEATLFCRLSARICSIPGASCPDRLRLTCSDGTRISAGTGVVTTFDEGDLTLESPKSEPPISVLVRFLGEIQGSGVPAVMRLGEEIQNGLLTGECEVDLPP